MIGFLNDEHHERLWRICDALVTGAGARAAMVCDASTGAVLVCVGDATGRGSVSGVEPLGPGEQVVHGDGGEIYGVDIPGGALLAVLHDRDVVEQIRAAAVTAVAAAAELVAQLPPPAPASASVHSHHGHAAPESAPASPAAAKKRAAAKKAPAKKRAAAKKAPAKKRAAAKKPRAKKQAAAKKAPAKKRAAGKKPPAQKAAKRKPARPRR